MRRKWIFLVPLAILAIPLVALTGDTVTAGRAWAANVVRL